MLGPAGSGRQHRPAPAPRRQQPGNEPPGRRRPVLPLSPLGCDSDIMMTAGGPPRRGRPAALGPTRSRVARHERTCDSEDSERAGGEEAAARATTSQAKMCLANKPTNYHDPPCLRREGVLDWGRGHARQGRRDAPICNKGVVLSRTRSRVRART